LDRQELGHHLRRYAIRQEAAEARRTLHQFRRRLIRAEIWGGDTKAHKLSGSRERYENGLFCRDSGVRFGAKGDIERGLSDFDARRGFADGEPLLD
jgi:hypothetical protein